MSKLSDRVRELDVLIGGRGAVLDCRTATADILTGVEMLEAELEAADETIQILAKQEDEAQERANTLEVEVEGLVVALETERRAYAKGTECQEQAVRNAKIEAYEDALAIAFKHTHKKADIQRSIQARIDALKAGGK